LLRSLRGRDLLAQRQVGASPPQGNITSVNTLQMAYPHRRDSVREGMVSYMLSQIHPREHDLINQLINAVTFPETAEQYDDFPTNPGYEGYVRRALSCDDPTLLKPNLEAAPCIDDPMTRAAIIGAIEVIGLEALREINPDDPRHQAQRDYVQNYLMRVRQLLTQEISPVVTEVAATGVVERIMTLADPANPISDLLANNRSAPTASSPSVPLNESPTDQREQTSPPSIPRSIHSNLAATRYTLALPFSSIYSCAGAAYSLARLGVYNDKTVDQLIDYLLVYPEPLHRLPLEDGSLRFSGNSCMPTNPDFGDVQPDEPLPSALEQLIIFKTGAIEALGAIEPHSFQAVRVVHRDNRAERGIEDDTVNKIVTYLVRIANLEVFAPDILEAPKCIRFNSEESANCNAKKLKST